MNVSEQYRAARDRLMALDLNEAVEQFSWPHLENFIWP